MTKRGVVRGLLCGAGVGLWLWAVAAVWRDVWFAIAGFALALVLRGAAVALGLLTGWSLEAD